MNSEIIADKQQAEQELLGIQILNEAHIPTASLLHHGWVNGKSLYVFLYQIIQAKHDFELSWQLADEATRLNLLNSLVLIAYIGLN